MSALWTADGRCVGALTERGPVRARATLLATGAVYIVVAVLTIWAPSLADLDRRPEEGAGSRAGDVREELTH